MLFYLIFITIFIHSYSLNWKAVNLENQTVYEFDSEHAPPTNILRLRINVTHVETEKAPNDPLIVYIVRLRWKTPHRWNENTDNKTYDLICELQDHLREKGVTIIDRSVSSEVNGLDERFSLPSSLFSLICAVRPRNARYAASWTYSKLVTIDSSQNDDVQQTTESSVVDDIDTDRDVDDDSESAEHDSNPLAGVTIMKQHIANIDDRQFFTSNSSNETDTASDDSKKSLLELLKMSKLILIEDGQPIRSRPTGLTIEVKPDIPLDGPPFFSQKMQLQIGKSSENRDITELLLKNDTSIDMMNSSSNSSEISDEQTQNSTVNLNGERNNSSEEKSSEEVFITQLDAIKTAMNATSAEVLDEQGSNSSEVVSVQQELLKSPALDLSDIAEIAEAENVTQSTDSINTDNATDENEHIGQDSDGMDNTGFTFESKDIENEEDDSVTGMPLNLEEEAGDHVIYNSSENIEDTLLANSTSSSEDHQDEVNEKGMNISASTENFDGGSEDIAGQTTEQIENPVDSIERTTTVIGLEQRQQIQNRDKDILLSVPRSEQKQLSGEEIPEFPENTEDTEETTKQSTQVIADYDNLESELRAAIGADEENLERLKELFSGGFPEGLLRVL